MSVEVKCVVRRYIVSVEVKCVVRRYIVSVEVKCVVHNRLYGTVNLLSLRRGCSNRIGQGNHSSLPMLIIHVLVMKIQTSALKAFLLIINHYIMHF